ncbi:pre-mRNA splicing factor component-domain-containing protein [Peziza echinospora]|nr:pre-mRNA splicing factor component-domain-containing protein [Peziza echinospora]
MPVVKGGVWSNVEDEILKASVSKYGLNQWQRVSSLLARKSAKQCKARWSEWLDPSIRKVEFSREEDEKLLHLAKLFPTQWRSIAKMVGRTASQCLDRYQKLLDEAESREADEFSLEGPGAEARAPTADEVRKFRPGETDPDPETKPARPDAVDMDEDEKEMLSEARARLANTQGKKAKRKARERQLEESRRLAVLQKRRELKHAGINIKLVNRKKGEMDYNADIPFEKKPALGFYDTAEEDIRNEKQRAAFDPRKAQSNSKRKGDQNDDDADRKKRKNDKNGTAAAFASAAAAGKMQKIREAEQLSKRRSLNLPAPQVSETELEAIVKMGVMGEAAKAMARQSENDATRGLVGDYTAINTGAPIRTPRAPATEDHIANEIRNIKALTETQSSLLGGENTPLHTTGTTGFDGIAPRKMVISTPNPLATPFRGGAVGATPGATPLRPGQTPLRTPRDTLAINQAGDINTFGMTPRDIKLRETSIKEKLRSGFSSLPKPVDFEYELPDEETEESAGADEDTLEEDAAIRDERERKIREAEELAEFKRRTQTLQRGLPRPSVVDVNALFPKTKKSTNIIDELLSREMALLITTDALRFPVPGGKVKGTLTNANSRIEKMDDEILSRARNEILSIPVPEDVKAAFEAEFGKAWDDVHASPEPEKSLPGLGIYAESEEEKLSEAALQEKLVADIKSNLLATAAATNKLEKKLALHYGGYMNRSNLLRNKIVDASEAIVATRRELVCFEGLLQQERVALPRRLQKVRAEVEYLEQREREAQEVYKRRTEELQGLKELAAAR